MAALEVIALDTSVPQLMAPQAGDTYTFPRAVEMPLGTANGVLYLDGSKVVTSGSALTFDGAILGVNGVSVGRGAGAVSTNTAVGASALAASNSGTGQNVGVGRYALTSNTTGADNTAVGHTAGWNITTGAYNVALGSGSLQANTTASNNTAVGYQAGYSNTTGASNQVFGYQALYSNQTGNNNAAFGTGALYANTGSDNAAFGSGVTAVAGGALVANTSGERNAAFGNGAASSNTTGNYNTALGALALFSNTTASNNTAVGYQAGYSITTGSKNTILGRYNGNQGGLDIRTANNYIVLSDGDGNPRAHWDSSGNTFLKGSYVSFGNNGYIRTDETNFLALQAGSAGFVLKNNGNGVALLAMSGGTGNSLALEGASVQTGVGITFPSTQVASSNANTLDDYERGDWTPALAGSSTPGTFPLTAASGKYTKVGDMVTLYCAITVGTPSGSPSGNLEITGLPFSCAAGTSANGAAQIGGVGQSTVQGVSFSTRGSSSVLYVTYIDGSNTAQLIQAGSVATSAIIDFCISYPVA